MVFDGDWNGGERVFRVDDGQELELRSLGRVDPATGQELGLRQNSAISGVDEYGWAGPHHLRWRLRSPSDPPLRNREVTYVIDYTLRNILIRRRDGTYELSHDFAFPDRTGDIRDFSLRLDLDPVWKAIGEVPRPVDGVSLRPGQSYIVLVPLAHEGVAAPTSFLNAPSPWIWMTKIVLLLVVLFAASLMLRRFIRREEAAGRYLSVTPTPRWLDEHIFSLRPEVVGAAWDHTTSDAEVAALLALMAVEGKIRQTRQGVHPELTLLVDRDTLSSYERAFVDQLFIAGNTIDPETLREHYKSTGFDPSTSLRLPLAHAAKGLVGGSPMWASCGLGLAAAAVAGMLLPILGSVLGGVALHFVGYAAAAGVIASVLLGINYQARLRGPAAARAIPVPAIVVALLAAVVAPGVAGAALFAAVAVLILQLGLYAGRWRGTAEHLERLRNFLAARRFFEDALFRHDAAIEPHWIPYMLAFGLAPQVDQWSVGAPQSAMRNTFGGGSGSGSSPSSFSGGGGGFGGAGATGGWASGLASFASAVPSPSSSSGSSSGSGGGGSSGSSSGGGGGGGW